MKSSRRAAACIGFLSSLLGLAATLGQSPIRLERFSGDLDSLISADSKLEKLATGFKWTEGPVWMPGGYLLFAEIPSNSIRKWTPGSTATEVFLKPSGYKGESPYGGPESGSNGMTLDPQKRLTVAGHAQRDVFRLETADPKSQITVLADHFHGKKLNSPNDLVYNHAGDLYFTDPPYGLRTQSDRDNEKELKVNGVYRLPGAANQPAGSAPDNGKLELLIRDMPRPNGIAVSPDQKVLYINNSEPKKFWMRYTVQSDGSLTHGAILYDATADKRDGSPDGMKVDRQGNLYSAGPGGIWIFSAGGKHIGTIDMPEKVGNLAWGDADAKTLYITASASLYRVRVKVAGILP